MDCSCWGMIAQAKEELETLETQHPGRLGLLKAEVKSFILFLESEHLLHHHTPSPLPSSFSVGTQESSTSKKRKKRAVEQTAGVRAAGPSPKRSRIDAVLDRAISCLKKIQELKSSLR
ncbi:hypothetical protein ACJRO7_003580 [Eucalyptus globulus]|uniref:Uncharacterized protein n=1 Tax=Eucalyptus globulus TaxID=34317 RepID=A0ABD3IX80_EUCGL